jgi:hypothetical protein
VPVPNVAVTWVLSFGYEKIVPKSVIFAWLKRSNKIFFGLMSPCIIRGWRPWRWYKPRATPQIMSNRWDQLKICSLLPSGKVPFRGYNINDIQCVTIGKSLIPRFYISLKSYSKENRLLH